VKPSDSVGRLLTGVLGYSLQANAKTVEGEQHPDRDAQFHHTISAWSALSGTPMQ
jgi:hypothetical protein